jgi:hypothetical protein
VLSALPCDGFDGGFVLAFELRVFSDPRADQCSECGIVTAANVARHVACRLQCVLPDLTGKMARLTH